MTHDLAKPIIPVKESLSLVRFGVDNETKKVSIEGISIKYDAEDNAINKEPIRLKFRDEKFEIVKKFINGKSVEDSFLHLLLRKLEIDRKLSEKTLCDIIPNELSPFGEIKNNE